ncbi:ATP-binding cassette, subfamily B [Pelagirhabdus alkalitolerans]|uniref:ATP-binding cassette, subfamily B n=1 Tax=Pelagirhabdus alkalitolerans TaxID=1612202 RepID=A0A1G6GFW6_9BACI|nr:ABC transporter ATP-binding protein [Pelagirhabdus alkalitolerans]SDB80891.1 ATP-binding cassette, subfamily B [Pelagirhabdus alkalitolerans]
MKTLRPYLSRYRLIIVLALSLMLFELVVELASPLLLARLIDDGILTEDLTVITYYGLIMIVLSVLGFIGGIINSFLSAHVAQSVSFDLRQDAFRQIMNFSNKNHHRFPASSLVTRLTNDIHQFHRFLFMSLRIAARAPLLIIGSAFMAIRVDGELALILVIAMPLLVLFFIWLIKKGVQSFRIVQRALDRVNLIMRENLAHMRLIKAFLRHSFETSRFHDASDVLKDRTIRTLRFMEMGTPVVLFFMNLSIIVILFLARGRLEAGTIEVGEVVAIVNYATRMMYAISLLSFILMAFSRARASYSRMEDVLTEPIDILSGEKDIQVTDENLIHFDHVSFYYHDQDYPVLKNIEFTIQKHETVALIGSTGSGKSTLIELISRLYDPTEGTIYYGDQPLHTLKLDELRSRIGYVPQESQLFSGTIRENIRFASPDATDEMIKKACRDAQIAETIEALPDQYDTHVTQRGVNLSGGQKQRLAIARAFISNPELLILDDATSALDLKTEKKLLDVLASLDVTVLLVTQKVSTFTLADRIILLDKGEIKATGTHQSLQEESKIYRQIVKSQS